MSSTCMRQKENIPEIVRPNLALRRVFDWTRWVKYFYLQVVRTFNQLFYLKEVVRFPVSLMCQQMSKPIDQLLSPNAVIINHFFSLIGTVIALYLKLGTRHNQAPHEIYKQIENRIVGGRSSGQGDWPWAVAVNRDGSHICGATLLSSRFIVSAAHCFNK